MLSAEKNRIVFGWDAETVVIEAWGKDALRVRAAKLPEIPETEWALTKSDREWTAQTQAGAGYAEIVNGKIKGTIDRSGKIIFRNQDGKILLEEFVRNRKQYDFGPDVVPSGFASALDIEAREFRPILGGDYALTVRFESDPEEKIYGMGQYQQPNLDCKGCELELAHRNSQASVPFAVSSLGYGFLWNNPAVGRVSFAKNVTVWTASSTRVMDYWITAGDTPAEILENYCRVAGTPPMMPDWAMGFWQSKLRYQTKDELLSVAREYKRRGVPLSVIVVDFFHWTMQGEWKFDKKYWPDPQAMVDELREMGVQLMVSIWPTVDHRSENFHEMEEKGYLIRTDRGQRISMTFQGNTVHFDATNPAAREYVWDIVRKNYFDYGIRLFWLDEAEPEYNYYDFDLYRYHLGPDVQIGNLYPMLYARGFYEGMRREGMENIINLVRCAWAGSQRYGALVWSGDIDSSFRSLRNQFAAGLNMGMAGIPWWTTDIGGFHGGEASSMEFRECFVRWFEYGTFCAVMRLHGDREPHSLPLSAEGGGTCPSGAANEIWSYGEDVYAICKFYIGLRSRMQPYIREQMKAAHERGLPPMRTLFFGFPQDSMSWQVEDEFLFGPDLLIAPILYAGMREREVYLPAGEEWKNLWTGETVPGGQTVTVSAPLEQIPVFLRVGAGAELEHLLDKD